jgi:hypothetical protein
MSSVEYAKGFGISMKAKEVMIRHKTRLMLSL